jgi:hypothetical protein
MSDRIFSRLSSQTLWFRVAFLPLVCEAFHICALQRLQHFALPFLLSDRDGAKQFKKKPFFYTPGFFLWETVDDTHIHLIFSFRFIDS